MNLRDLRYLVALADLKHFGKAADICHVSQPTLSTQLKKLEVYLGLQLVERTQRQVMLTDIGKEIATRARNVVREADEIIDTARQYQDPLRGKLRIGFIPTLGPYLLPYIVSPIQKHCPNLELLLFEDLTHRLLGQLRDGDLDAAVLALPLDTHGLTEIPLFSEPFVVALPKGHALTKRTQVSVSDLEGSTLLLLEDGHCLRDQALDFCGDVDTREREDFRATSLETLRHMVGAGAGITLLPKLAAMGRSPQHRSVVTKPFAEPVPYRRLGIVERSSCAKKEAIAAVGEIIRNSMRKVLPS